MSDIDVEIDDGVTLVIGNDNNGSKAKRRRGKDKEGEDKEESIGPETNGLLTITLHIITSTSTGDQLTKSRKSITIVIEDAGFYIDNIDLDDALNNVERPYMSARNAHGLVINHLGQKAAQTLLMVASGEDPKLYQKIKIHSNPEHLVRSKISCAIECIPFVIKFCLHSPTVRNIRTPFQHL